MPLFVRAGSIVPVGPAIQHTGESLNAPMVLNVYTGSDGSFEIYEDDGLSYDYENGQWSRIPVRYDDASGTLYIGDRAGSFDGMAAERPIGVRFIDGPGNQAIDFEAKPDTALHYMGEALTVERPR